MKIRSKSLTVCVGKNQTGIFVPTMAEIEPSPQSFQLIACIHGLDVVEKVFPEANNTFVPVGEKSASHAVTAENVKKKPHFKYNWICNNKACSNTMNRLKKFHDTRYKCNSNEPAKLEGSSKSRDTTYNDT